MSFNLDQELLSTAIHMEAAKGPCGDGSCIECKLAEEIPRRDIIVQYIASIIKSNLPKSDIAIHCISMGFSIGRYYSQLESKKEKRDAKEDSCT